jgi:predicted RNase H-like nuclease (RuvC/YqgF family)
MKIKDVQSNLYTTAIPLLAIPKDINISSVITDITKILQAKDLKLSAKSKSVKDFTAAGGSDRTKALEKVLEKLEIKVKGLKAKVESLEEGEEQKELKEELECIKAKKAVLGKWTVILYDEGKCPLD